MSKFQNDAIFWVDIDKIDPNPYQPRRDFNEESLRDLAESIRQYGVLQPLTVTRNEKTKEDGGLKVHYELIAGERRLRAAKLANLSQVPVTIRDEKEDAEVKLELAIIENLQREDLNPIERAEAFDKLAEKFDFTHKEIAEKIGKSREYVSNSMRLLKLPEKVKQAVISGKISEGHTRPIMMLRDNPEKQEQLFKEIIHQDLTVRESEKRARRDAQDKVRKDKNKIDPETKALEDELSDTLGTRVQIEKKDEGGKLVIDFFSEEDLENLVELVKSNDDVDMQGVLAEFSESMQRESEKQQADEDSTPGGSGDEHTNIDDTEPENNTDSANDRKEAATDEGLAETLGSMIQDAREEQQEEMEGQKRGGSTGHKKSAHQSPDESDVNDREGAGEEPHKDEAAIAANAGAVSEDDSFAADIDVSDTEDTTIDSDQSPEANTVTTNNDRQDQDSDADKKHQRQSAENVNANAKSSRTETAQVSPEVDKQSRKASTDTGEDIEDRTDDDTSLDSAERRADSQAGSGINSHNTDQKSQKRDNAVDHNNPSDSNVAQSDGSEAGASGRHKNKTVKNARDQQKSHANAEKEEGGENSKDNPDEQESGEDDMYAISNFSV